MLSFICKASVSGSALVADFFDISVVDGISPLKEAQTLKNFVENEGSALMFGISEEKAEDFFKKRGFDKATRTTTQWCKERYFSGASHDRLVSSMFNLMYAVV